MTIPVPAATVLIVDDEIQNRKLLEALLKPEGYLTLTAANGEEALALVARRAPDLILLDVMMPGMNGYQVVKKLKSDPATSNIPVIMVTALIDRNARIDGLKAGAEEFLTKPVEREELWLRVRNLLRMKTLGDLLKNHNVILEQQVEEKVLAVRASEVSYRRMFEAAQDGILILDFDTGRINDVNPCLVKLLGLSADEMTGRTVGELSPFSGIEPNKVMLERLQRDGYVRYENLPLETREGRHLAVEFVSNVYMAGDNKVIQCNIRDITERKLAEVKIQRLNRVYAVLSGINGLIVRVNTHQELFDEACRIAVEHGNFGMAWIGRVDQATQNVTPVAWAGLDAKEYLDKTIGDAHGVLPKLPGMLASAIHERRPVFSNDLATESRLDSKRREEALRRGYRSLIVLPLIAEGAAVGNLSLLTREIDFVDAEELRLLSELAADISFAIKNIHRQYKFDKLARIRAISSEINAAIIRIHERDALLREICRVAVESGKFELIWIALLDHEKQIFQPLAWEGFSAEIAQGLTWANVFGMPGATLPEVIQTRKVAVRNDIDPGQPAMTLRREAIEKGCRSTVCVPFMVDDTVVAAMLIFAEGQNFFDEGELALLNEMSADVSFALDASERQNRLEYLSHYDMLTGLPNRTLFQETLKKTLALATDRGWLVAVLYLDVDNFKNVNDTLGHSIGDELLVQFSARLLKCVRIRDTVGRLGGDEFALILLMEDGKAGAAHVANKIRDMLCTPFDLKGHVVTVTVSIGITIHADDTSDPETLMKYADTAMYRAKQAGRDTYRFFTAQMNIEVVARLDMETALRKAVENGEFVLHYQPKAQLHSGRIIGVEALLRWQRPGVGLVQPSEFIPALEETGLIVRVGSWVVATACRQIGLWMRSPVGAVPISVNVSGRQFIEGDLHGDIIKALSDNDIAADLLELELTESSLMVNTESTIASLNNLKKKGVRISIDDFGTGYSSLAYLSRFPIDTLKIDIAFIRDVTSSPDHAAIVRAIIRMAHSLKLDVVAEGVETAAQLAYLRRHGCDHMQGYYFSRPLPLPDLEQMLREGRRLPVPEDDTGRPHKTLLLVDDEPRGMDVLQRLLLQDGYQILLAQSAVEGFELLALHPVQVILCDQRMPGMSGTAFLDRVKELHPDTFRMILSAYADPEVIMDAINRGTIHRFYTKPLDSKVVRENVREAFRQHQLSHGATLKQQGADPDDAPPPGRSAALTL